MWTQLSPTDRCRSSARRNASALRREPPVELCLLLWRQDELSLTHVIGEAFPEQAMRLRRATSFVDRRVGAGMTSCSARPSAVAQRNSVRSSRFLTRPDSSLAIAGWLPPT